jgi:hypothetical protein
LPPEAHSCTEKSPSNEFDIEDCAGDRGYFGRWSGSRWPVFSTWSEGHSGSKKYKQGGGSHERPVGVQSQGEVEVLEEDLESFASVDAFAAILKTRLDHLDIAVMNAGLFSRIQGVSADGYNVLLQVCKEVIPCFVDTTSRFLNPFSRLIS